MTHTASRATDRRSTAANEGSRAEPLTGLEIRHLHTAEDFAACMALQRETWGAMFSEMVPSAILKVSQRIGGVSAGAFHASGRLIGFVFGMTGVEHGHLVHWSDMLAVRPEWRDRGVGRRLKEFQRDALLALGVERMYWTYDPLVARNAHLNLNRLGARVVEYVVDMYGSETDSALHRGIGSDRFVVAWRIAEHDSANSEAAEVQRAARTIAPADARDARIVNAPDASGVPIIPELLEAAAERVLRVEIPLDIERVQADSLAMAARWRAATRAAFTWAFAHGYEIASFTRDANTGRAFYVLAHASASANSASPESTPPAVSPDSDGAR